MKCAGRIFALLQAVALALPIGAVADVTLVVSGADGQSSIQVKNGMGRMDTPDGNYLLFDRARDVVIRVEPADGGYTEFTQEGVSQMAQAAALLHSQLARQIGQAVPARITAIRRGTSTVAGMTCDQHELMQDARKIGDACMAKVASGQVSKDDFATLLSMMGFLRTAATEAADVLHLLDNQLAFLKTGLPGVPLSVVAEGQTFAVTSVSTTVLDPHLFTDYQKLQEDSIPILGP